MSFKMAGNPKILIIGAGAAGIAAASRLLEKGFQNVLILEAKNRIGGRIHTVKFADNVIELGAQWCHGEKKNVVYDLASPYNLLKSSTNIHDPTKHIFVNSLGEIISKKETVEVLRIYYKIIDDLEEAVNASGTSYGDYFTKKFYEEIENNPLVSKIRAEQFINWMQNYHNSIECSDSWFDVSATRQKEYWSCEGDALLNWKTNGYSKVFDLLTKNFPDPKKCLPVYEKILFNKQVSLIDYSFDSNVKVITCDDSVFQVSNVIFTPSLGVLKEQHTKLFKPPLPESKVNAIKGFNIGVANKIFLEFPHRWWPENIGALCFMWSQEQKQDFLETCDEDRYWLCDIFQFFTVDFQPRVLSGWVVGPHAKYMESLSDEKVLSDILFILQKFLGNVYDIPKPLTVLRSKWFSDKHFRGSYSYRSLTTEKLNVYSKDLSNPIKATNDKPLISFAGEATHEHYFSTVHGAIETGFREADRLIDYYRYIDNGTRPYVEGERVYKANHIIFCGLAKESNDCSAEIIALCLKTSGLQESPHEIRVKISSNVCADENIHCVCSCKASILGKCKHSVAVLIHLHKTPSCIIQDASCTDLKQQWGKLKQTASKSMKL